MPFTPFHLGPGALIEAIGGERFSFMIFGGSHMNKANSLRLRSSRQSQAGPTLECKAVVRLE